MFLAEVGARLTANVSPARWFPLIRNEGEYVRKLAPTHKHAHFPVAAHQIYGQAKGERPQMWCDNDSFLK